MKENLKPTQPVRIIKRKKNCPKCGEEIDKYAKACPFCGQVFDVHLKYQHSNKAMINHLVTDIPAGWLNLGLALVMLGQLLFLFGSDELVQYVPFAQGIQVTLAHILKFSGEVLLLYATRNALSYHSHKLQRLFMATILLLAFYHLYLIVMYFVPYSQFGTKLTFVVGCLRIALYGSLAVLVCQSYYIGKLNVTFQVCLATQIYYFVFGLILGMVSHHILVDLGLFTLIVIFASMLRSVLIDVDHARK